MTEEKRIYKRVRPIWTYSNRKYTKDKLPKSVNDNGMIEVAEYYSMREVAYMFGVTNNTMLKWLRLRLLPSVRMVGETFRDRQYQIRHRALMKYVADNPDKEFILEKLQGDLDKYEPRTLEQKQQEILRAIARSPREPSEKHDPIHQNRNQTQDKARPSRREQAADRRFADNYTESDWPW